ncbi:hypothetical protein [Salinisphaera orenii]|uniref:Uncharacterized protein n=1 Tax=Salinisphaera orenii YIM 95161 TaxID=1051139 RepID=A0A423PMD3_9GAMM|nr:hypothetical protein [Salinisphaera halophila]ROO26785.1 hypothetical protein SAHL_12720 [Salinisphaera halophila YIM 95161]
MLETLIALIAVLPVIWAHYLVRRHTRYPLTTHALLIVPGLLFGGVCAFYARTDPAGAHGLAAFSAGFGAVHLPGAVVLSIKHARARGH